MPCCDYVLHVGSATRTVLGGVVHRPGPESRTAQRVPARPPWNQFGRCGSDTAGIVLGHGVFRPYALAVRRGDRSGP